MPLTGNSTHEAGDGELLLVAGPASAGKTTFMKMLRRGELNPSLEAMLPEGARDWPQFGDRRRDVPGKNDKIVLHYTIIHPRLVGSTFGRDRVLAPLEQTRKATILTIRTDALQALRQYEERRVERLSRRSVLRNWVRLARQHIFGRKNPEIATLYRTSGWLEECYAEWDAYLNSQARTRELIIVDVATSKDASGRLNFKLVTGSQILSLLHPLL